MCSAKFALVLGVVDKGKATVFLDQAESLGVCAKLLVLLGLRALSVSVCLWLTLKSLKVGGIEVVVVEAKSGKLARTKIRLIVEVVL